MRLGGDRAEPAALLGPDLAVAERDAGRIKVGELEDPGLRDGRQIGVVLVLQPRRQGLQQHTEFMAMRRGYQARLQEQLQGVPQKVQDGVGNLVIPDFARLDPVEDGQHGALVSFAFNLGHSTAAGKPLANIAAVLNRGDYDGALRRMGLYVKQRQNGRLVTVPGLVNRRAAEAGLWARGEFVASRHVAPATPPAEGAEAAKLGGYAAAAATAAPALQALAGVPVWVGVALVVAIAMVAVALLLRRERAT